MRALSGLSRVITGTAAIAVVIGMASAGGAALAATNGHGSAARTAGVTAPAAITHPAQAPVSSPGIIAPPDVVVGEADGSIDLPVTLTAPGLSTVTVSYAAVDGTATGFYQTCAVSPGGNVSVPLCAV